MSMTQDEMHKTAETLALAAERLTGAIAACMRGNRREVRRLVTAAAEILEELADPDWETE